MKKIIIVTSLMGLIFLSGCSVFIKPTPDSSYDWVHSGKESIPMSLILVKQQDVQALCCNSGGFVMACAWRDYENKECKVFTSFTNLPEETLLHEQKHCDGWEHPVISAVVQPKMCKTPDEVLK